MVNEKDDFVIVSRDSWAPLRIIFMMSTHAPLKAYKYKSLPSVDREIVNFFDLDNTGALKRATIEGHLEVA